jgi:hypothetical protein
MIRLKIRSAGMRLYFSYPGSHFFNLRIFLINIFYVP